MRLRGAAHLHLAWVVSGVRYILDTGICLHAGQRSPYEGTPPTYTTSSCTPTDWSNSNHHTAVNWNDHCSKFIDLDVTVEGSRFPMIGSRRGQASLGR